MCRAGFTLGLLKLLFRGCADLGRLGVRAHIFLRLPRGRVHSALGFHSQFFRPPGIHDTPTTSSLSEFLFQFKRVPAAPQSRHGACSLTYRAPLGARVASYSDGQPNPSTFTPNPLTVLSAVRRRNTLKVIILRKHPDKRERLRRFAQRVDEGILLVMRQVFSIWGF
jgi:hypothetical protein